MEELMNWGVGLVASAATLSLLNLAFDEVSVAGFLAAIALVLGVGCMAASTWRGVLQSIAKIGGGGEN